MAAGESAHEVARRNREKAERLLRVAHTYERGAQGEEATAQALAGLPGDRWRVIHDVRWPGRRYANIDHLVVGPGGIFVIDSKHWSGRVEVRDQVLMQNGRKREKAVAAAADSAIAVAELLPGLNPDLVRPVLCFVRDEPLHGWARDVIVCSTSNVVAMLESRRPVFVHPEVQRQFLRLQSGLTSATLARPSAGTARALPARRSCDSRDSWASRSRTASSPRVRVHRPRRRRSKQLGSLIAGAMIIAGAFVGSQSGLFTAVVTRIFESLGTPSVTAGEPLELEESATLPPLKVTVSRIVRATPVKADQKPPSGRRLWAVRLDVRNQGAEPIAPPWPISARVVAGEAPYAVESDVTRIRQGPLLALARPVAPGKAASGFLVFELPAAREISQVRITYGAKRATWKAAVAPD